jgi:hypothetical protein
MKQGLVKKTKTLAAALSLSLVLSQLPSIGVLAAQPYFKAFGGDVATGGWFNDGTTPCINSAFFQDDNFKNGGVPDPFKSYGGIYSFSKGSASGDFYGSSSEFAAYSLGTIDGDNGTNGFYTGSMKSNNIDLSFANSGVSSPPAGYWAGLWGGAVRNSANCIPDYYGTKAKTPNQPWSGGLSGNLIGQPVYAVNSGSSAAPLLSGNLTIARDAWVTVFVNGNLYINHNINYAPHTVLQTPRFALVVKGSIYIDPAVTNLDGLYIAQPDTSLADPYSADSGAIWIMDSCELRE